MGAKRPLNGTSKVNRQTNTQTDKHIYGHFDLYKASAQRADALKITWIEVLQFCSCAIWAVDVLPTIYGLLFLERDRVMSQLGLFK